jgi:hypothetical protein
MMTSMTSEDGCYCVTCGTCADAISAHSCDESSDISRPLLLPPIVATDDITLDDRCYYWACGMHEVSISLDSTDGPSNISGKRGHECRSFL